MTQTAHTPTPWQIPPDDLPGQARTAQQEGVPAFPGRAVVGADGKTVVCIVLIPRDRNPLESEANGRLIVTAVNAHDDLLAACKKAWKDSNISSANMNVLAAAIANATCSVATVAKPSQQSCSPGSAVSNGRRGRL